jgi:hypothetical protein
MTQEHQMDEESLLQTLEAGNLPHGGLPHVDHVRLTWHCLRQEPLLLALCRVRNALLRAATAAGRPERYHETVTVGYVLLIAERLGNEPDAPWEVFAARNSDLLTARPSVLARFYSDETLASERARDTFVMPDRQPARC